MCFGKIWGQFLTTFFFAIIAYVAVGIYPENALFLVA